MITIRDERPGDAAAIAATVTAAFAAAPHAGGNEAEIVARLRAAGALRLSLVAEDAGLVGHLGASPASVGKLAGWMAIAPVSVAPAHQRRGVGTLLMRIALDRLQAAGAPGAVLVGDPDWYARFGFAARPGLTVQGVPAQYVLAVPFGSDTPRGEILFHPAFGLA
ncbi:MAG: N-acetyltransferase [Amaricoccus sp.]